MLDFAHRECSPEGAWYDSELQRAYTRYGECPDKNLFKVSKRANCAAIMHHYIGPITKSTCQNVCVLFIPVDVRYREQDLHLRLLHLAALPLRLHLHPGLLQARRWIDAVYVQLRIRGGQFPLKPISSSLESSLNLIKII